MLIIENKNDHDHHCGNVHAGDYNCQTLHLALGSQRLPESWCLSLLQVFKDKTLSYQEDSSAEQFCRSGGSFLFILKTRHVYCSELSQTKSFCDNVLILIILPILLLQVTSDNYVLESECPEKCRPAAQKDWTFCWKAWSIPHPTRILVHPHHIRWM